jgi:flagellar biosynthesis protein FlhB
MAQDQDKESKTEAPTEKKISDAVEKGNIPRSREMSMFASLVGILLVFAFLIGPGSVAFGGHLIAFLDHPGEFNFDQGAETSELLRGVALEIGAFLMPMVAVLAVAGFASSFFQHAPSFTLEQIRPKWSRLSLGGGWKRIFGKQGWLEFLKSVFKFSVIAIVCVMTLKARWPDVANAMISDPTLVPGLVLSLTVRLVSVVCVMIALLAIGDLVWSRHRWRSDLRMTRQELKDEVKQSEGDPLVKSRLRSLARDRARRRMISSVPRATLVIANPTHYSIAIKYERGQDGAPMVLAKGVDLIALRIREIASRHAIPIVEDRALARAMYDAVEVGQWIPQDFYRAVAKILFFLYSGPSHARSER